MGWKWGEEKERVKDDPRVLRKQKNGAAIDYNREDLGRSKS